MTTNDSLSEILPDREPASPAGDGTDRPPATAEANERRRWARLLAASRELNRAASLREGLERLGPELRDALEVDNLAVLLLDENGRELRFELGLGYAPEVVEHWRFGLGQGIVGTVAATGKPLRVGRVDEDSRYLPAAPGTRAELAVPLEARDHVIGVLDVGSHRPDFFGPEHEEALSFAADCLATAIDGRRLYESLHEQARSLSVLHEVSRELSSIHDRRRVLERVASRLKSLVDYDVFTVYLWSELEQQLEPWLWLVSGRVEERDLAPLALGEGITGTAAALRQLIRVPNVSHDPRYLRCQHGLGIRSELAVPLVFEDRLIGVLDLESLEIDHFRPEHEQLVSTLASSLAIALANAEMVETLQEREQTLHQEMHAARFLQRQLLPRSTPWVKGLQVAVANEPARHLGGDFYDFLRYGDGRVAIAVGDVAGKATSAALYASLAIGILREFSSHSQPMPAEMLARMNDKLLELEIQRRFVAMTFAVYDSRERRLWLANSGLPYPFLVREGRVEEIELGGVPLGLIKHPGYLELEIDLRAHDTVVITTDGLSEALDERGHELGSERLGSELAERSGRPIRDLAEGLLEVARVHTGRGEASDDRTVVVLRACEDC